MSAPTVDAGARARLAAVEDAHGAALALVLRETEMLGETVGRRDARRIERRLRDASSALPPAALALTATLHERRRRADSVGTWYADD
jgi:hypothetical protein